MKRNIYALLILVSTLALDIVTKILVVRNLNYYDRVDFLGGFLRLTLVYNEGGVFGIMQGYKNVFLIVSIIVLGLMIAYYVYEKNKTMLFSLSMALIISGAIGNIIDRLVPSRPGVVDFISVGVDGVYRWPSFNVADSCIVMGAFLLVIVFYQEEKKRKAQEQNQA
ncbi:MAG: signal peptidase II [Spirochaetae bacterium HGW-Spirochaetae-1]|jgi:signal peptidase II|nr:MAG: signal peptidase II [Spirochaetae bacterium HGW-Spirochaetae-1]